MTGVGLSPFFSGCSLRSGSATALATPSLCNGINDSAYDQVQREPNEESLGVTEGVGRRGWEHFFHHFPRTLIVGAGAGALGQQNTGDNQNFTPDREAGEPAGGSDVAAFVAASFP